jgi:hypothetical protein
MDPRRYEDWFIGVELGLPHEFTALAVSNAQHSITTLMP